MAAIHRQRAALDVMTRAAEIGDALVTDEAQPIGIVDQFKDEGSILRREPSQSQAPGSYGERLGQDQEGRKSIG